MPEEAKFSKAIFENEDSTITTEIKNLETNKVINRETYKGDEPFGVWISGYYKGVEEKDYSFELNYSQDYCINNTVGIDLISNNDSIGYKAPVLDGNSKKTALMNFLSTNLRYPPNARINGIEGIIYTSFTITQNGIVENIIVVKGVDISLDKEAVRVIRKLKFKEPPMLNNIPKTYCYHLPIRFRLG